MFSDDVAKLCQKYGPQYGILVNSPIIAQFILESSNGTSELAKNANNYCGLKYKLRANGEKRCPTALNGIYYKVGSEQDPITDEFISFEMAWFRFKNLEDCAIGYYDFTNTMNYANLKGVTSPKKYCELIKEDNYATDKQYAEKLMKIIDEYDLTRYDGGETMLKLALGAGHGLNTSGKRCLKSIDPKETREWVLNDRICDLVEAELSKYNNVQVVRLDDTTGQKDVALADRKKTAEAFKADIYLSVHHNAGINGGNGGGTVVFYYPSEANKARAQRIYNAIVAQTGLVGNRAEKIGNGSSLYECKQPTMPSYIIENGFMDSTTDTPIILTQAHAEKTARGIVNFLVSEYGLTKTQVPTSNHVSVSDLKHCEVVMIDLADVARKYGKDINWILKNNPNIYQFADGVYLASKDASIIL